MPAAVRTVQNILEAAGTGRPIVGRTVSFRLNTPAFTADGVREKSRTSYATTDEDGMWSAVLEVNDDLDPPGTSYTVQEMSGLIWTFIVPAGDPDVPVTLRECLVDSPTNPAPIVQRDIEAAIDSLYGEIGGIPGPLDADGLIPTDQIPGGGGAAYMHSLAPTAAQTEDFTAATGTLVPVDLLSTSVTATLPTTPADQSTLYLYVSAFATGHILTIAAGGTDRLDTTTGPSTTVTRSAGAGQSAWLQYDAANALWRQLPDRLPLSLLDARYDSAGAALAAVGGTPLEFVTPVVPSDIGALASDAPTFTNTLTGPTAVITTATVTNLIATAFKIAAAAGVGKVLTSDSAGNAAWTNPTYGAFYACVFGTGTDGAVVLDGTTAFAGATLAGSTYTMTRAMRATTLVVNAGVTLDPAGFRVFATTSITVAATAFIRSVGNNGTAAGVAGAATAAGSSVLGNGFAGGAGNTGAGSAGGNTASIGALGGAGGAGASGAAGAAGTTSTSTLTYFDQPQVVMVGVVSVTGTVKSLQGGAGGGGGGGDGTNKGGGGGGGGPMVALFAPVIVNNGTIQSQGGNGGTPTTGNCGGGGAGAPGVVLTYSLSAVSGSGTLNAPSGTPGSGAGTGANGSNSSSGVSRQVLVQ